MYRLFVQNAFASALSQFETVLLISKGSERGSAREIWGGGVFDDPDSAGTGEKH